VSDTPTFVLVPGAGGTSFGWTPVVRELALLGHRSLPVELPGHGFDAIFPDGYQCPQNLDALARARSPLAELTLADYVEHTTAMVRAAAAHGPVVLVGHSLGGSVVTGVANTAPDLLARIVYVAAFCCVDLPSLVAYAQTPENAESLARTAPEVGVGDPTLTGAMRTNPRTGDPRQLDTLAAILMADLDPARVPAVLSYATQPDESIRVALADARVHVTTWGRIARTYIRTTKDRALPIALQDRMIAEADRLTPDNPFNVLSLNSSHLAPITRPAELAALLVRPWASSRVDTRSTGHPRIR
jgi:pimeloyl-ACP methyl ester carboxylesterase